MRVDTSKIRVGELMSLADAARMVGCHYEKLRRARNEGRLVTLATNPQMTTGSQLIRFIEDPKSVKAKSQIRDIGASQAKSPREISKTSEVDTTARSSAK